jgi:hypothetical protein
MRAMAPLVLGVFGVISFSSIILAKLYFDDAVQSAYYEGVKDGEKNAVSPDEQEARCLTLWGLQTYKEYQRRQEQEGMSNTNPNPKKGMF